MPAPAATERTLRAILQYVVDPRGVKDVKKSTDEVQAALMKLDEYIQEMAAPIREIGTINGRTSRKDVC